MVVRTDLAMGKGKIAAQCAHAAVGCYKQGLKITPDYVRNWETFGQTKVALKADSLELLQELKVL
jgi:PTH2 family peptidyl-tRNA hydrolase